MIKAIIFDCGGVCLSNSWKDVIFDSIPKLLEIDKKLADEIFYKHYYDNGIILGKESEDLMWIDFIKVSNKKITLSKLKNFYYSLIHLHANVFELVKRLSKKYILYTLNNEGKEWMDFRIKKFNLKRYFTRFFCSAYLRIAKPNPEIYKLLLKETKLKPAQCLFIDDNEKNIKVAKKLSMKTILFKSAEQKMI